MLISSSGTLVRTPVGEISVQGRNTQGVRLIRLDEGERLVGLERIVADGATPKVPKASKVRTAKRAASLRCRSGFDRASSRPGSRRTAVLSG